MFFRTTDAVAARGSRSSHARATWRAALIALLALAALPAGARAAPDVLGPHLRYLQCLRMESDATRSQPSLAAERSQPSLAAARLAVAPHTQVS